MYTVYSVYIYVIVFNTFAADHENQSATVKPIQNVWSLGCSFVEQGEQVNTHDSDVESIAQNAKRNTRVCPVHNES